MVDVDFQCTPISEAHREDVEHNSTDSSAAVEEQLNARMRIFDENSERQLSSLVNKELEKMRDQSEPVPPSPPKIRDQPASIKPCPAASSSYSLPRGKKKPISPSPSYYNPLSNYSPRRPIRRQIMGISLLSLHNSCTMPANVCSTSNQVLSDEESLIEDDVLSMNSETLERSAMQIRTELRHAEMMQLALEAERASEAGKERFSGKPSTYGYDDLSVDDANRMQTPLRRQASYSEGTNIPVLHTRRYGAFLKLRDVEEVFPSFREFHKHVRTHLSRQRVNHKSLVFNEKVDTLKESERANYKNQRKSFLDTFTLERWVGKAQPKKVDKGKGCEYELGSVLAEHICSEEIQSALHLRPKLQVPLGLEMPQSFKRSISDQHRPRRDENSSHVAGRRRRSSSVSSNPDIDQSQALDISPRALFDMDDDCSSDEEVQKTFELKSKSFSALEIPKTPIFKKSSDIKEPDFLTPARLRDIRDTYSNNCPNLPSLIPPANSALESPKEGILEDTRNEETHNPGTFPLDSLLMPEYLGTDNVLTTEQDCTIDFDKTGVRQYNETNDNHITSKTNPDSKMQKTVESASGDVRKKRVVVSVHSGLNKPTYREDSFPTTTSQKMSVDRDQSVTTEEKHPKTAIDSTKTPDRPDCVCMALSPASSIESTGSLQNLHNDTVLGVDFSIMPDFQDTNAWKLFPGEDVKEGQRHETMQAVMDKLSHISPRASQHKKLRSLCAAPRENDAFMRNFLYSSTLVKRKANGEGICAENDKLPCGEDSTLQAWCTSLIPKEGGEFTLKGATHVSKPNPSGPPSQADSWFDRANERFDFILERLLGGNKKKNDEWTFQAPSLQKHVFVVNESSKSTATPFELFDEIEEKKFDEYDEPRHSWSGGHGDLQPLYDESSIFYSDNDTRPVLDSSQNHHREEIQNIGLHDCRSATGSITAVSRSINLVRRMSI